MKNKIKIGILLNSYLIPIWYVELLKKVIQSEYAEISLIIINGNHSSGGSNNGKLKNLLYRVYNHLDKKVFYNPNDSQRYKDATELLRNIPSITVQPQVTNYYMTVNESDLQKIDGYNLDVLFRIGFGIIKGGLLGITPLGIWSYHHGDPNKFRGMPSCFWEIYKGEEVCGSILQRLSEDLDGGQILARGYSKTENISLARTRNFLYWRSASYLLDCLKECHAFGIPEYLERVKNRNLRPSFLYHKIWKTPGNLEMVIFFVKILYRILSRRLDFWLYNYEWAIISSGKSKLVLSKYKIYTSPNGSMSADPSIFQFNGTSYVFFENIDSKLRGSIHCIDYENLRKNAPSTEVLMEPFHLSFPFVFNDGEKIYMVPETKEATSIKLYECRNFPNEWIFVKHLLEGVNCVDTHLLYYKNKWWLFTNMERIKGAMGADELHIFYADEVLSSIWTPHPLNPVIIDARSARNAGKILEIGGELYRPSQNCAKRYGYSVSLNKIETLDEHHYAESESSNILPFWEKNVIGIHSIAFDGTNWVMDARYKRSRFSR